MTIFLRSNVTHHYTCHCIYLRSTYIDLYAVRLAIVVNMTLSAIANFFLLISRVRTVDLNGARLAPIKKHKQTGI